MTERFDGITLEGLSVAAGEVELVRGVSLSIRAGELVALVGGSGSGKTLTARALLGMLDFEPGVRAGALCVRSGGIEHRPYAAGDRRAVERAFRPLRGTVLGYLPQDARGSLDPLRRVGRQVSSCLRLAGAEADPRDILSRAGFGDPDRVARCYPHELSGGMAQRASIAMALARGSRFLVADEPTTGLDPTVARAILGELAALKARGVGVLFITHDLRLLPRLADRVLVMSQGALAEELPAGRLPELSSAPGRALLEATARISGGALGPSAGRAR